jgi:adenylate cyclase
LVLAGTVGSPERLVYAMVGDTVNLASRIQGLNKQFRTDILISRTTKERLKPGKFELVSLGQTAIRGKSGEVEIYKVV